MATQQKGVSEWEWWSGQCHDRCSELGMLKYEAAEAEKHFRKNRSPLEAARLMAAAQPKE